MTGVLARIRAFFFEPSVGSHGLVSAPAAVDRDGAGGGWAFAAVVGPSGAVVPVAAACAGELRARGRAAAALVCIWRPEDRVVPPPEGEAEPAAARSPAAAATPGARRLAARLAGQGLAATACGRLAWLALDRDPVRAVDELGRCRVLAGAPAVLALAGPRHVAFEPLVAAAELAIGVLPPDAEPALRALVEDTLPHARTVVVAPRPPGPPRWAALAGLTRLRSLPEQGA